MDGSFVTHISPMQGRHSSLRHAALKGRTKVVLFYPPYDGPALGPPLCMLALAAPLLKEGFDVVLVDGAIDKNILSRLEQECADGLCLGISVLTGPMITWSLRAAAAVKRKHP
jgi:anaerobic magnesium-protoporphyrin IX monomethyl ester cyclase